MRHSQLRAALLLAVCLFGAAARAQTAASTTATGAAGGADVAAVVQQLLSGGGVFQTAVPSTTGGVAGSVKASKGRGAQGLGRQDFAGDHLPLPLGARHGSQHLPSPVP